MNVRTALTSPTAFAMILAGALAIGATSTGAVAQVYPSNGNYGYNGYNNNAYSANDRTIAGTVSSFGGFAMQLSRVSRGNNGYRNKRGNDGDDNRNWNNGNGRYNRANCDNNNGRGNDGDDNQNNGCYGNRNGSYNNGGYNNGGASIRLHQGTVINPTGASIQPGMRVRVTGHPNGDGTFEADRIDLVNTNYNRYY